MTIAIRRRTVLGALSVWIGVSMGVAGDSASRRPSEYAPIQDIVAQIDVYWQQLRNDLASQADYGDDQKSRVSKDANTLVVLAQLFANHDDQHARKASAPALFSAARELAGGAGDYAAAKAALEQVSAAVKSGAAGDVKWEAAADLVELMKQVPIVNNRLRSGVTGRRFERTIEQNAGHSATLAAIAQASIHDTGYCSDAEDEAKWVKICADMRDAAAAVNTAVRSKDQPAATAALARLAKTCDDCHHDFRD